MAKLKWLDFPVEYDPDIDGNACAFTIEDGVPECAECAAFAVVPSFDENGNVIEYELWTQGPDILAGPLSVVFSNIQDAKDKAEAIA